MGHIAWPEARKEQLRKLWTDGLSCRDIAAQLGDGLSRNAVIGMVTRMGLSHRPRSGGRPAKKRPVPRTRTLPRFAFRTPPARPGHGPVDLPVEQPANPVTLLELTDRSCRWPSGNNPATMLFCGATSVEGQPYCERHCRVAFQQHRNTTQAEREALHWRAMHQNKAVGGILGKTMSNPVPGPIEIVG
jgi:GcrA cell cycle regulator